MNEVIKNIKSRRSCRAYKDEQIGTDILNEIIECALCGPSGMNKQGCYYTAIQNKEILQELNKEVKRVFKERGYARVSNEDYNFYYNAPTLIIVTANKDYKYFYTDGSAGLENIFLAATSLGLGSCWINQLGDTCNSPLVRRVLDRCHIPSGFDVIGCAAIGYPAKEGIEPKRIPGRSLIIR